MGSIDRRTMGFAAAVTAGMALLAGCQESNTYVEPPPPTVTVARPLVKEVTDYLTFTGSTVPSERVEVRARVSGFLEGMHFVPGTDVVPGELLFAIDPKEYEAELEAANAELASARAQLKRAQTEFARSERLFKQKAGSEVEVVKWRGELELANAAISRAEAQVDRAKLTLSYTDVRSPLTGRVGRNLVDIGNLVGEGEATVLTDVTAYDPMYVYFSINEHDLLRLMDLYRKRVKEKGLDPTKDPDSKAGVTLEMGLSNEEGYPHRGVTDFAESGLDAGTGTLQLRGVFDNPGNPPRILPGLFARVRLPIARRPDMPLVTERAVGTDQSGRYLLVVNSENRVEKRIVRLGQLIDGLRVIEEGIRADARVVVNGLQRARPGGVVVPEETDMASLTLSARMAAAAPPTAGGSADATATANASPSPDQN